MKIKIFISIVLTTLFCGCGIEEQVNKAVEKCEDKGARALEGVEDVCLSKEEVLELIDSIKESEIGGVDTVDNRDQTN